MNRPRRTTANYIETSKQAEPNRDDTTPQNKEIIRRRKGTTFHLRSRNPVAAPTHVPSSSGIARSQEGLHDGNNGQHQEQSAQQVLTKSHDFPDEILTIIFEFYSEDRYHGDPWPLMHVCRRWRRAATYARRIWSRIILPDTTSHSSRRYCGYEVCHTSNQLQNALARAAGGPLEVRFEFGRSDTPETPSRRLINVLRDAKAYYRIHTLSVMGNSAQQLPSTTFDEFVFPELENAYLTNVPPNLIERIQRTAFRLHLLELPSYHMKDLNHDLSAQKCLRNLHISGGGVLSGSGLKIMCSPPGLVALSLTACRITLNKTLSIPTLQKLTLSCATLEGDLKLPQLQTLNMSYSAIFTTEETPLSLPCLATLEMYGSKVLYVFAPSLHTLSISKIPKAQSYDTMAPLDILTEQLIKPGRLSPRKLRLRYSVVDSKLLIRFLNELPLLEEIDFGDNVPLSKGFFEALAGCPLPLKAHLEPGKPTCPALKSFKLSLHGIRNDASEKIMMKWPHLAVQARAKGQYPIQEALIQEKHGVQWVSML
ncbi:hypothetical protein FRC15_000841 [Serendipita sp. 397]|nr:hypothetical protein FRC15_000841 [Serendipita sp. 397]